MSTKEKKVEAHAQPQTVNAIFEVPMEIDEDILAEYKPVIKKMLTKLVQEFAKIHHSMVNEKQQQGS